MSSDVFQYDRNRKEAERRRRRVELEGRINSLEGEIETLSGEIKILEEKKAKYVELIKGIEEMKEQLLGAINDIVSAKDQLQSSCTGNAANSVNSSMEASLSGISQINTNLESIKSTAIGKRNTIFLNLNNEIEKLEEMKRTLGELEGELASLY